MSDKRIGLVELVQRLSKMAHQPVPYHRIWDGAVSGRYPAEKFGSSWTVREDDLPLVLEKVTGKRVRRERLKEPL
jgi:hypothetical protein